MKKLLVTAVVVVMGVMLLSGAAFAANVALSATVSSICGPLSDGNIPDFAIAPNDGVINKSTLVDGASPAVSCTKGSTVTVTCPANGVLAMVGDTPAGDIPFTVTCPAPYVATGFSAPDDVDVGVSFAAGAAANSAAGAHTGSIVVTVAN
jgi:hypothetical protein